MTSLFDRLSLVLTLCLGFHSGLSADTFLELKRASGQRSFVRPGESFEIQVVIASDAEGFGFNGLEAAFEFDLSGLVYESLRWTKPFAMGEDDLSVPASTGLPQTLTTGSLELANVAPDGLIAGGGLVATLRFGVPQHYAGPSELVLGCPLAVLFKGFVAVPVAGVKSLRLRVGGAPPADSEIVWQETSGLVGGWQLHGRTVQASALFDPNSLGDNRWEIVAAGDFDRDGSRDFILALEGRTLGFWQMSGLRRIGSGLLTPESEIPEGWRLVGSGDMDGDFNKDLVFEYRDGHIGIWYMKGFHRREGRILEATVPPEWSVAGAADMDGDGAADLVLRHSEGYLGIWFLNRDGGVRAQRLVGGGVQLEKEWSVVALRDIDQDGFTDLVLRHRKGLMGCWSLSGDESADVRAAFLIDAPEAPASWRVVAP